MAGGADAMIFGSGFADQPSDNMVRLATSALTSNPTTFQCPPLTILDEFHSKTSHGRLYQRLPSASDLTGGTVPMDAFKAWDGFSATLSVDSGAEVLTCGTASACKVSYKWSHTPLWYYLSSPVMYSGKDVSLYLDPRAAPGFKLADKMAVDITLEDTRFLTTDYSVDWNLSANKLQSVRGTVRTKRRAQHADLDVWFRTVGNALKHETHATSCNWDGTDCYSARILPHIDTISETGGSSAGGQELTLTGGDYGDATTVEVTVDGVDCKIKSTTASQIVCQTGAKTLGAPQPAYPGEHGLYRTYDGIRELLTAAEIPQTDQVQNSNSLIQGFYEAPVDGLYQFHMSCDDNCSLKLSTSDPADPAAAEEVLRRDKHTSWRNFYHPRSHYTNDTYPENSNIGSIFTLWMPLTGGVKYYMESDFGQGGGDMHWTVGVEINPTVPVPQTHPHMRPGRHGLFAHQDLQRDTSQLRIVGADGGTYRLMMLKEKIEDGYWQSDEIAAGCAPGELKKKIKGYYKDHFGTEPTVTLECGLNDGTLTPDCTHVNVTEHVYTIEVPKSIPRPSQLTVTPYLNTTRSGFEWVYSSDIQLSNPPLSGSFFVECSDTLGNPYFTGELPFSATTHQLYDALVGACPWLRDNVSVWNGFDYHYNVDGLDFLLRFHGVKGPLSQVKLHPSATKPLTGVNLVIESVEYDAYGPNVYYDVLPFEQLYTYDTAPPVRAKIDGMPVLCKSTECAYTYEDGSAEVQAFSVAATTVTITGVDLPTSEISVRFANQACEVSSSDASQIVCTLPAPVAAGTWVPEVRTSQGLVALSLGLVPHVQPLAVQTAAPDTFYEEGGQVVVLSGAGFPEGLDTDDEVSVTFSDGTVCALVSSTATELECKPAEFETVVLRRDLQAAFDMIVVVNGQEAALAVTLQAARLRLVSITPASVSPIIAQTLVLELNDAYDTTDMELDTFTVGLAPRDLDLARPGGDLVRWLNVVDYDKVARTITVKYGGAYSGKYQIILESARQGAFRTGRRYEVKFEVTDFYPKEGSQYGGQLVTIEGGHFSDDPQKTPIKIGYEYTSGVVHYCDVVAASDERVTCRMRLDYARPAGTQELIVFASAFEEARCRAGGCDFEFLEASQLAWLETRTASYNGLTGKHEIEVTGYDIPDVSPATVQAYIGGEEQTVLEVTATRVLIQVDGVTSGLETQSLAVYLEAGAVNGFSDLYTQGVALVPEFKGLQTSTVSSQGSTIFAEVSGLGVADTDVTLATVGGESICDSASVTSYGWLECRTKAMEFAPSTAVKLMANNVAYTCNGELACTIETFQTGQPSWSQPSTASDTTIQLVGTSLGLAGATGCTMTFAQVEADSCLVDASGDAIGTFNLGVPAPAAVARPELAIHTENAAGIVASHTASYPAGAASELDRVFAAPTGLTSITCSFAGGCEFEIGATGLAANVAGGTQRVTVCGNEATLDVGASDAGLAVFAAPELTTAASEASAGRAQPELLEPRSPFSSPAGFAVAAFDGANVPGATATGANCFVGVKYDAGKAGILDEVRFFMDYFADAYDRYDGKLKFQGSDDDFASDIVDIFTVGAEIHEGWNSYEVNQVKYSSYRLFNAQNAGCDGIGELKLYGKEVFDNEDSAVQCIVQVFDVESEAFADLIQAVTYDLALTSYVSGVVPAYGSVEGGTLLAISGPGFATASAADVTVLIDGVECDVSYASPTSIECTTRARPGLYVSAPTFEVSVAGRGKADVGRHFFRYMSLWSETSTWGGQFAPVDGESVVVPAGLNLLVDIDASPLLNMVLVDGGSIVFPSDDDTSHERTFDAKVIMVNKGAFEAGTEDAPYASKLTITLHGAKYDPTVPIYGNKVLGVRYSTLDLHGRPRDAWTSLDTTAAVGATDIVVQGDVDWEAGETIMITSTGFDRHEAEQRVIATVARATNGQGAQTTTLSLTEALEFEHHASATAYGPNGSDVVEIRAEVALMERNVIFQGDETSLENEYGAHILIHAPGDNANIGRISNVQFQNVGQFGQLGRYPVHFHMEGAVHESYVENNVFLNSVNRGTTLHGVEYLRLIRNVYYNTKGHTVFVEDGVETKNRVEYNLVINTEPSFSLLNTDSTPACFWLTNPDNILIGNHCAGSEHYGFWYDLVEHPTGPSVTSTRCPINEKLGRFTGNVAHSMPNYGLRIFHGHSPRTRPCAGLSDSNPTIQAYYEEFLAYKAGRNGVIGGNFGAVTLRQIQAVDNALAGIEYEKVVGVSEGTALVEDSMVVGRSGDNWDGGSSSPHGIISPRTDGSVWRDIRFYNFDFNSAAAIGTCSHCYSKPSTDSDARTVKTEALAFTNVDRRIRYQYPFRGIINDLDGSLTGLGADSWATAFWQHNAAQPECQTSAGDREKYDGILCTPEVEVRRVVIYGYQPGSLAQRDLYLLPYDEVVVGAMTEAQLLAYEADASNYSVVDWRPKANPSDHWCVPYVTGKKYYARWEQGLDFEKMKFEIVPWLWDEDDLDIEFELPFYDVRVAVHVDDNLGNRIPNNTIADGVNTAGITDMGDNLIRNDTETRRINFRMNGDTPDVHRLTLTGVRCIGGCTPDVPDDVDIEARERYWSVLADWDGRAELPKDGEEVTIPGNWNMFYDIAADEAPVLSSLEINGRLTFQPGANRLLKTYNLWVRAGELIIGAPGAPFPDRATIELQGDNTEEYFAFTPAIEAGNKNLVITGKVQMVGLERSARSRLRTTVLRGMATFAVDAGLGWLPGEQVVLAPTNMRTLDTDICTIASYEDNTGWLTCEDALMGYHFGADESTEAEWGVDMRGEVALLARNIEITASQHDISHTAREPWGCRILVSDFFENNLAMTLRTGTLNMDNVSVYKCSQKFTWKSAIKFENAILGAGGSTVSNSVIHQGQGPGIIVTKSSNISLIDNTVADFAEHGIWVKDSSRVLVDGNWVFHVVENKGKEPAMFEYFGWVGGFTLSEGNRAMEVRNNIAAGTWHHGFHVVPSACGADDTGDFIFRNNVAHSISGYGVIGKNVAQECTQLARITAYKVTEAAIMLGGPSGINRGRSITAIDTRYGVGVFSGGGGEAHIINSQVYGELTSNADCPLGSPCDHCVDARGVILNQNAEGGHGDREEDWTMLPLFKNAGAMRGGGTRYQDLRLINFTSATKTCGSRQAAIMPFLAPDYTPYATFTGLILDNVAREALTYIQDPPQGWANLSDCVEFTCTGMYNIVMHFDNTRTLGTLTPAVPGRFTIISDNKESVSAQVLQGCDFERLWNAWECSLENIGVMIFDNLDPDRWDRALHPVYIRNADLGFDNRLNSYMDHCWDGFYTCQKRESRFPTLVWQEVDYEIEFTGTPPQAQEFRLIGRVGSPGFVVSIRYNAAGAYQLYDAARQPILPTDWDSRQGTWAEPRGRYCGEWRYEGVVNRLQFYIENFEQTDCVIYVQPRDAVMLGIRLEFTLDEFFADGGVVTFADRMAAVLGIHAADVKVVAVYEGSTIIEFQVVQRNIVEGQEDEEDQIDLAKIDADYREFIQTERSMMDSRILSAQIEGVPILTPYQQEEAANFDWNEFEEGVLEQEETHSGTKAEETEAGSTTTKVITRGDGTKEVVTVDESGEVVAQMKRIYIEQAESPAGDQNAYLILCFVVLIAIVAIVGVICIIKKCGGKSMRGVAETVQHNVKGQPVKGDFLDFGDAAAEAQEEQQYRPTANDVHLVGTAAARPATGDTASQQTAVDTARELLSEREVAPVRMDDAGDAMHAREINPRVRTADTYE